MGLLRETLMELMAFADGELKGADRARVEALVAESEEARRVVESIRARALGEWLEAEMGERAERAGSVVDAVMGRIAGDPTPERSEGAAAHLGVVRMDAARPKRRARVQLAAGVVAVAALAAGVLLYVRSDKTTQEIDRNPIASVVPPPPATTSAAPTAPPAMVASAVPVAPQGAATNVEVDEVESSRSRGVSVFEIPMGGAAAANAGQSSVVIWIDDESGGGK
jgi:hypothetical protein